MPPRPVVARAIDRPGRVRRWLSSPTAECICLDWEKSSEDGPDRIQHRCSLVPVPPEALSHGDDWSEDWSNPNTMAVVDHGGPCRNLFHGLGPHRGGPNCFNIFQSPNTRKERRSACLGSLVGSGYWVRCLGCSKDWLSILRAEIH